MADDQRGTQAAVHTRKGWRPGWRALATVIIGVVSVGLLLWVAPPDDVGRQISDMNPFWVLGAVAFELASCLSYVIIFRRFFPEPPRSVGRTVAWIAMGAGAVLPGGNISSAAATGVLLRRHGIGTRRLVTRCAALLSLLTGFGFLVNGAAGVWLLLGLPGGPHDLSHTGIPILVSIAVLGTAALVVHAGRRLGATAPRVVRALAAGLQGAWSVARTPHWRLVGVAGFLCLDMAALWAACAATGHPLGFPAIVIAYCIGYLATAIPMPAGLGVLDTGLAASLVLYGLSPPASVSAVLVYHAIAIWVPGLGGLAAWLPTSGRRVRRRGAVSVPEMRPLALARGAESEPST
ncbi:MAG TPA: lysylphosphatidylglycerol synthase transmembrane domain-containing protein [Solirubrobacteraceae bacterium]|nr:lysylphosphatidylglycerol synthase transmembrane domain-containing protein [Solirubrobacteraceae bacterium]